jgi:hypothetical protein
MRQAGTVQDEAVKRAGQPSPWSWRVEASGPSHPPLAGVPSIHSLRVILAASCVNGCSFNVTVSSPTKQKARAQSLLTLIPCPHHSARTRLTD